MRKDSEIMEVMELYGSSITRVSELSSFFLKSAWYILLMSLWYSDRGSIQMLLHDSPE